MTRSIWKGPFLDPLFLKSNFLNNLTGPKLTNKIWSRSSTIPAFLVGQTVLVHNGKEFKTLAVTREKIGFKFGAFVLTRTFTNKYKNLKAKKKKNNFMGQKANLLTVRKTRIQTNLLTSSPKLFIYGLLFVKFLEKLLRKKNVLLVSKEINFEANKCFLKCAVFFKASKLSVYQQKHKLKKQEPSCEFYLNTLIQKHFALFDNNFIQISFINLNKSLKKESLRLGYLKIRRFLPSLFSRRFTFFIDFVKLSSLFSANKISAESFLFLLGFIFRTLPKKKHNMFLIFSQILFSSFISKTTTLAEGKQILGVKFLINGRLKGKPRSNATTLLVGSVPVQSLEKDIQFSKLHVNTIYGVFGFQIWVYRK